MLSLVCSEPAVSTLFGVAVRSLSRVCTVDVGVGPSLYVAVTYPTLDALLLTHWYWWALTDFTLSRRERECARTLICGLCLPGAKMAYPNAMQRPLR